MKGKLQDASSENTKLLERIKSIEALLEAGQMREAEKDRDLQVLGVFNWGGRRITLMLVPVLALLSRCGVPQRWPICISRLGQVMKVISVFQAANEAEMKQMQLR